MPDDARLPLTRQGYDRMKADLKRMKEVERPAVSLAIEEARAHGDLSENAEYHAARERMSLLQAKIAFVEDVIARAQVIEPSTLSGPKIRFGATVTLFDVDQERELKYQIVGEPEADIDAGLLSVTAPLGRALIGREEGDDVEFKAPGGIRRFSILSVEYR